MSSLLHSAVADVLALETLTPNQTTNGVMSRLVEAIIEDTADTIDLSSHEQTAVRTISAAAESELEIFWARAIITSADPAAILRDFPYINNYKELTRRELELVAASGLQVTQGRTVLVVGSGPLPLSSIEIMKQTGATVHNADSSKIAIDLCLEVMSVLGYPSHAYHASGQTVHLSATYDVILVAALAGATTEEKQAIINNLLPHLKKGGRIILRSARGSRELLYPAIKATSLSKVALLKEYHPDDYIINSVLIYQASDIESR